MTIKNDWQGKRVCSTGWNSETLRRNPIPIKIDSNHPYANCFFNFLTFKMTIMDSLDLLKKYAEEATDHEKLIDMVNSGLYVNERLFKVWRLEIWWVAFGSPEFYPEGRIHIYKNIFWRKIKFE